MKLFLQVLVVTMNMMAMNSDYASDGDVSDKDSVVMKTQEV